MSLGASSLGVGEGLDFGLSLHLDYGGERKRMGAGRWG